MSDGQGRGDQLRDPVLRVEDLTVEISGRRGVGRPVNGVSLEIFRGEILGLVGESGSGKSLTALAMVRLLPAPAASVVSGRIIFRGIDLLTVSDETMRRHRGAEIATVLQDPTAALNPVLTIETQVSEPLRVHTTEGRSLIRERVIRLLSTVGIPQPAERLGNYPHQFSGGMRQRVVSAMALSCEPQLLIADEPTTALDVTIQAGYLDTLRNLQTQRGLAVLFITHDLGVVSNVCDRVAVMYAGRIVETAATESILEAPRHPYTQALLKSVPDVDVNPPRLPSVRGAPPSMYDVPTGCPFHPRCDLYEAMGRPERCRIEVPDLQTKEAHHPDACHFSDKAVD